MENKKASRTIALNRVLFQVIFGGLGALLAILMAVNVYSVIHYRRSIENARRSEIDLLADSLGNNIEILLANGYNIYVSDENFEILRRSSDAVESHVAAEALCERLYSMMKLNGCLDGFVVSYNNGENVQSFYDRPAMNNAQILEAKAYLQNYLTGRATIRECSFVLMEGIPFAMGIFKRDQVAVAILYSLQTEMTALQEGEERLLLWEEEFLTIEGETDLHKKLIGKLPAEEHIAQINLNGLRYFGEHIDKYHIWILTTYPNGWKTYLSSPQLVLIAGSVILLLLAIYGGMLVRNHMLLPLRKMISDLNRIQEGDLEHRIETGSRLAEIQLVADTIEQTLQELEHQKNISYEQTIEKQKAQMQYLSMQLKPHFYLNGLKTLNALAMSGEKQRVQDLIMRLSDHMRYILQLEKDMVLLKEEIDYVNNYAELQRNMTDRPLEIEWDVEEGLNEWKVPTLCIQTFVENSFKYAKVGNPKSPLILRITINCLETEDGRFLDLNIGDNGRGYPDSLLDVINGEPTETSISVGINNLKRRCKILYGEWAEYSFYNDTGACSELIFPWR